MPSDGRVSDRAAHFGRTRERDLVDTGMGGHRRANFAASPRDDVDDTVRDPGLLHQFREAKRRQRREFGRLDNRGAAGGKRGRHLPCHGLQREVPRHDHADDADRFLAGVGHVIARQGRLDGAAMQLRRPAGEIAEGVDRALHVDVARIGNRLAHVDRFDLSQFRCVRFDQIGEAVKQPFALKGFEPAPRSAVELFAGRFDRAIQIGGRAQGNVRDDARGGRFEHRQGVALALRNPGTANKHPLRLGEKTLRLFPDSELLQVILYDLIHHCLLCYGLTATRPLVGRFRAFGCATS